MTEKEVLQLAIANDVEIDPSSFKDADCRHTAYLHFGWTEKALNDEDWRIRIKAYRSLGWTEKAFDDNWEIRIEAYRALGWTEKAFNDDELEIRREAKKFFKLKKKYSKTEAKDIIKLWQLEHL